MPLTVLNQEDVLKTLKEISRAKFALAKLERLFSDMDMNENPYAVPSKAVDDEFRCVFNKIRNKKEKIRHLLLALWDYYRERYEGVDYTCNHYMSMESRSQFADRDMCRVIERLSVLIQQVRHVVNLINGSEPFGNDGILEVAYYDQVE